MFLFDDVTAPFLFFVDHFRLCRDGVKKPLPKVSHCSIFEQSVGSAMKDFKVETINCHPFSISEFSLFANTPVVIIAKYSELSTVHAQPGLLS